MYVPHLDLLSDKHYVLWGSGVYWRGGGVYFLMVRKGGGGVYRVRAPVVAIKRTLLLKQL